MGAGLRGCREIWVRQIINEILDYMRAVALEILPARPRSKEEEEDEEDDGCRDYEILEDYGW